MGNTARQMTILTFDDLAKVLDRNVESLRREWKILPHFYLGGGRTRSSARFILEDVVDFLIRNNGENYGRNGVPDTEGKTLEGGTLRGANASSQERRISPKAGRGQVDTQGEGRKDSAKTIRFDVFDNERKVPGRLRSKDAG